MTDFFDLGGIAGFAALLWQTLAGIVGWKGRPTLRFKPLDPNRDLRIWTFANLNGQRRKFFTLEVTNTGKRTATRCVATLVIDQCPDGVNLTNSKFALHWAGIDYSIATTGAQPVDIGSEDRRLDVAFTVEGQQHVGCWIALPVALVLPIPNQAFLPPGRYEGNLSVSCENGTGQTIRVRVYSPNNWTDLDAGRLN